jgi:ribosome-associated protein
LHYKILKLSDLGNHEQLLHYIIEGLQEKKAKKIINIDLRKLGFAPCDNFIICHGDSGTQVKALSDSVEEKVDNILQIAINHREGLQNASWVLLDFGNIVVHIFQRETREYYKLEDLWGDGEITFIKED